MLLNLRRGKSITAEEMTEEFLHYIWQHRYFDHRKLQTADGRNLQVIFPGFHNRDAGPDFFQSHIKLDNLEWVGATEIHLKASDFFTHGHQNDAAYGSVILHVVWNHDSDVYLKDGTIPPVLVLNGRVSDDLLTRYESLIYRNENILCAPQLSDVRPGSVHAMIEQAATRRLEQKAGEVVALARQCSMSWTEVTYRLTARAFGLSVNAHSFLRLAQLIPLKIISRLRHDQIKLESLLFGMAGFLEGSPRDEWHYKLQTEYKHLRNVYTLKNSMDQTEWKFLRMRPPNFPTIRIAQFASFLHQIDRWGDPDEMMSVMASLNPSAYWSDHFLFGKKSKGIISPVPGKGFSDHLLINVWVPVMLARASYLNQTELKSQVIRMLNSLSPEQNALIRAFSEVGIKPANGFEAQGLILQYRDYCSRKRCLECEIGLDLLGRSQIKLP